MTNFDLLTFTISTTIAVLGLFVAILVWLQSRKDAKSAKETAEFTRKTTEEAALLAKETAVMSVKPYLSIVTYKDPPQYTATLENNGIWPAIIDSFKVYLDGNELVDDDNYNSVEVAARRLKLKIASQSCVSFASDYAFMATDKVDFFEITLNENNPPTAEYIKSELDRIDIVIEYSDIFGNAQKPHDTRGKPRF
ncbi:hypothetical protein V6238_12115 [Marinomonas arenicola]|uniref:hypothetical protein n=1 Tax=Marinomonas arenicola TaxID=569601 RepID=UPI00311FA044